MQPTVDVSDGGLLHQVVVHPGILERLPHGLQGHLRVVEVLPATGLLELWERERKTN